MPQRTLIAYITKGGATADYARIIADVLGAAGHIVDVVDLRKQKQPDLSGVENVVVGSGVRIGMVYRVGKRFLRRPDLRRKRLAIFLSSGIAIEDAEKAKQKFLDPLIRKYDLHPVMCDALAGKTPGPKDKVPDTTNPESARAWAEKLAGRLDIAASS